MKFKRVILLTLMIALLLPTILVSAHDGHYNPGGFAGAKVLKYWRDASVQSAGYHNRVDSAYSKWNNISTNVNISQYTTEPQYGSIAVYAGPISGSTVYAVADYYVYGLFGLQQVGVGDPRDRTRIRINTPQMNKLSSTQSLDVMIHEFGHALSLKHNDDSGASVMKEFELTTYGTPQQTDKDHLKQKWGN
ncbi:hypothetical protein [Paenibacillus sp. BR1-192]|uniref:hypothetical protein n=1 Tax=Paenibacillus sp. BR1-192 TaxID=3032287 RepID=UPI00240E055B|nr:hypothetical protein [Paenibacillus sp. BR1-192]WFB59041.1 hypothetical protein P0X86_02010 [Paenibacillus sp. BR1-192]